MSRHLNPILLLIACLLACPRSSTAEQTSGLVAYWSFDQADGNAVNDVTGHGHRLRIKGVTRVGGAIGSALCFSGRASTASTPLAADLLPKQAITVAAWARLDNLKGEAEGIGIVSAAGSYVLRFSGPTPSFHIFTTHWGPVQAAGAVRLGRWYHITGTYDGREMRIYVNGAMSAARRREGDVRPSSGVLLLGRQVNALNGCLDEVRIYGRCLAASEVAQLFEADVRKLNKDVEPATLVEPFEELFGMTRARPAPPGTLRHLAKADCCFSLVTDTHIGQSGEEGRFCHNWRVEEAIRQINAVRPDLAINCGDIITTFPFSPAFEGQCRRAVEMLKGFQVPLRLVPGNHDVGNQRNMRVWDDRWLARIGRPLEAMLFKPAYRGLYRKYFGDDYYSFQHGSCRFIVVNNQLFNSGGPDEEAMLTWLEQELKQAPSAKATFMFMHNPLFWDRPDEPGPKNYEPVLSPARQRVLALLDRHPITAVYTGHTHFAFANEYHGIHLRTINSTTFNRNYQGVDQMMSGEAQIYDPHKLGYLIVRVLGGAVHESWVPLYWRVPEPAAELSDLCGPRPVARPASEIHDGMLGLVASPPKPIRQDPQGRELINDHAWRLCEDVGAKWLRVRSVPATPEAWDALERALTLGRPRGVNVAMPLPSDADQMEAAWSRLRPHAKAISAVVVANGAAADPNMPLSSWRPQGRPTEWAATCERARALVGPQTKIVLSRLPLPGRGASETIRAAAEAAKGKADALVVCVTTQSAPEPLIEPITAAAKIARDRELELWLDVAGWRNLEEPRRSAYLLRLLAICQAQKARVFWWIPQGSGGGLLDEHWDPTPTFYALQSWQAVADAPVEPVDVRLGDRMEVRWRDHQNRSYVAWWNRIDTPTARITLGAVTLPERALVVDPLHGRILHLKAGGQLPVCGWPMIARGD